MKRIFYNLKRLQSRLATKALSEILLQRSLNSCLIFLCHCFQAHHILVEIASLCIVIRFQRYENTWSEVDCVWLFFSKLNQYLPHRQHHPPCYILLSSDKSHGAIMLTSLGVRLSCVTFVRPIGTLPFFTFAQANNSSGHTGAFVTSSVRVCDCKYLRVLFFPFFRLVNA